METTRHPIEHYFSRHSLDGELPSPNKPLALCNATLRLSSSAQLVCTARPHHALRAGGAPHDHATLLKGGGRGTA